MFSACFALVITTTEIAYQYHRNIDSIESSHLQLIDSYKPALVSSIWNFDEGLTQVLIDGIVRLPNIDWVEVDLEKSVLSAGPVNTEGFIENQSALSYTFGGEDRALGSFAIRSNLSPVYTSLIELAFIRLFANIIKTLCAVSFSLYVFSLLINRHLIQISKFLTIDYLTAKEPLTLSRHSFLYSGSDELDQVAISINQSSERIGNQLTDVLTAKKLLESDVTELNNELEVLQYKLRDKDRFATLGMFSTMIAHEIRNPLGTLDNTLLMMRKRHDGEQERIQIERMTRSVSRINSVISNVITSLEDGDLSGEVMDIDKWLVSTCNNLSTTTDFPIETHTTGKVTLLRANKAMLTHALRNLLVNADHAQTAAKLSTSDVNSIVVSCFVTEKTASICIQVVDRGKGISQEVGNVLRPLVTSKTYGLGLGLSVVQFVCELHKGKFSLERQDNCTVAKICIPTPDEQVASSK